MRCGPGPSARSCRPRPAPGKTVLAASIIESALAKGKRVIFTVPAISLVDQTVREFYAEGIRDVGVIQADHPMTDPPSRCRSPASRRCGAGRSRPADLVIIDEAHRVFEFIEDWMGRDEWLACRSSAVGDAVDPKGWAGSTIG
jgi:DNA repair protein RadD